MPIILAPGKLRQKVVKNLRSGLENSVSSVLTLGDPVSRKKKKEQRLNVCLHIINKA